MNERELQKRLSVAATREEKLSLLDTIADEFLEREKYADAILCYSRALRLETRPNVKAYLKGQIGICNYNLGNDREARQHLLKAASLFNPLQPEFMPDMCGFVYFHLGSLFEYQGNVKKALEARRACEKYIDSQEKDTKWMLYSGISRNLEALGKYDEAIEYSQKAIQVLSDNDPGLTYLYESMASNHMSLKQYPEAVKYFSKVLELDPDFEHKDEIYLKLADCYRNLTNDRMAIESYNKILELKQITDKREDLAWLYARIAHSYFRLEQYEQSLSVTQEALRKKSKSSADKAELRGYLTNNYYELGHYLEAAREGEKTLKIVRRFRNDSSFYFRMALSYHKLGDKKNFAKYRKLCRRMFPEDGWNKHLEKLG